MTELVGFSLGTEAGNERRQLRPEEVPATSHESDGSPGLLRQLDIMLKAG